MPSAVSPPHGPSRDPSEAEGVRLGRGDTGRCFEVRLAARPERSYPLLVGPGVWANLPEWLPGDLSGLAVVSEERVFGLHGEKVAALVAALGCRVGVYLFPPGEASKTRATKAELEDRLIGDCLGRDALILALGGGVVTDLAGFVAATYLRGLRYVSLPTTLLAMVDASIGGKTGVNTEAGKNLVGAFHQPEAVIADIDCLGTLPALELLTGLAETVKHAVIGDAQLFQWLLDEAPAIREARPAILTELVARSAAVKRRVVFADELEGGVRQILNFGHTIGHGLEKASGYQISHGQAVALGMLVEADAAVRAGLIGEAVRDRLEQALVVLGLPCALPEGVPIEGVLAALGVDKKVRRREVRYALPEAVGQAAAFGGEYTTALPEAAVRAALEHRARDLGRVPAPRLGAP